MNKQSSTQQQLATAKPTPAHNGLLQRACACGQHTAAGGECAECRKKREGTLQRAAIGSEPAGAVPPIVHQVLGSPGQPLDAATRAFMEPRFGHDFSQVPAHANGPGSMPARLTIGAPNDQFEQEAETTAHQVMSRSAASTGTHYDFSGVRIHADNKAAESARAVNALAYTVGREIVFDQGQYAPDTRAGQQLLAHELTHVMQQSGMGGDSIQRQPARKDEGADKGKQTATFSGCDTDEKKKKITDSINQAKSMAGRAIYAFERPYSAPNEVKAMKNHFGDPLMRDQKATILERYKHVRDNVDAKSYTCAARDKTGARNAEFDGEARCPGNEITLFPLFFREKSPGGPVILHEAAHNAGACNDIKNGSGYPPNNAEENAYSYENFAVDLLGGEKAPDLPKRRPEAPK